MQAFFLNLPPQVMCVSPQPRSTSSVTLRTVEGHSLRSCSPPAQLKTGILLLTASSAKKSEFILENFWRKPHARSLQTTSAVSGLKKELHTGTHDCPDFTRSVPEHLGPSNCRVSAGTQRGEQLFNHSSQSAIISSSTSKCLIFQIYLTRLGTGD